MAASTTVVDEKLRGSGLRDGESFTQMYPSFCNTVLAAGRKHIGLKAVGMIGEYWKTQLNSWCSG